MQSSVFMTKGPASTQRVARILAHELLRADIATKGALVLALTGDLGGGKTTFTQGFARGLGVKGKVLSPTFVLMKSFQLPAASFQRLVHIDAYRLEYPRELQALGWRDIVKDKSAIVLVEWADRVKRLIPKDAIHISFEFVDETTRRIKIGSTQ